MADTDERKEEVLKEDILIDEEEAKKEFLEELKTKNLEETQQIEKAKILAALKEQEENTDTKKEVDEKIKKEMLNLPKEKKKHPFFDSLKFSFVNTVISAAVSVGLLYLFDLILRLLFGLYIVDLKGVYIIILIAVLLFYPAIMENTKFGKALYSKLGRKQAKEREE